MSDKSNTLDYKSTTPKAIHTGPYPGSHEMPQWDVGELPSAPKFTARNWAMLIGPGLVMGGAAIGGGEWLTGPAVSARYGGALLWLATVSIIAQVFYNLEISRYTLYSGEPIFTGKFRLLPGPRVWLLVYILLDFGSLFPYLAANAATPVAAVFLGRLPDVLANPIAFNILGYGVTDYVFVRALTYICFLLALLPLLFGGKVYNSMKALMSFKIVVLLSFLTLLAVWKSEPATWIEIGSGFFKIGNVPVQRGEDLNGNGVLDPGEDWDGDGHLDVVEPQIDSNGDGKFDTFTDIDGDGIRDGDNVENAIVSVFSGKGFPAVEVSVIALLAAMASIAGQGGLTNSSTSAYVRDQGWGMGSHVGAIPSAIGGRDLSLSHVGKVFEITKDNVAKFARWYRHIMRDQLVVWMPACFIGLALPAMLSVQFLRRGVVVNGWNTSAMTADGVAAAVGPTFGPLFWILTLACGFLVLIPSNSNAADGFLRRWVDVLWTGSKYMRSLEPHKIRVVYFSVLCIYCVFGLTVLTLMPRPLELLKWATIIYNSALGFSSFHVLAVNTILLPKEIRPNWLMRLGLIGSGVYFVLLAIVAAMQELHYFG
jgi:hypothetical protein